MAFAVWPSQTTIETTAIPDIAAMKRADVVGLPPWYSKITSLAVYAALNSIAVTAVAHRWKVKKG